MIARLLQWGHCGHPERRNYSLSKFVTRCQKSLDAILIIVALLSDNLKRRTPTAVVYFLE